MNKQIKKETINIALCLLGILIIALTFNVFCVPNNYAIGGVSGISVIFNYLFDIDVSVTLLIGNLLIIIIGLLVLGIKDTAPSIIGSILYTLMVFLTNDINKYLNIHLSSAFLNIIVIGLLLGLGSTMVYLAGYSTGGTDVLGIIFNKKFNQPMGKSILIINMIILVFTTVVLGFEMLVIALLIRFLESKVIDSFLIGISDSKVVYINSEKLEEINDYIIKKLKSGTNLINVTSGFKKEENQLLMCVIPTEKYILLKEQIKKIDKNAFITIVDAYEVYGGTNRYKLPFHDFRI